MIAASTNGRDASRREALAFGKALAPVASELVRAHGIAALVGVVLTALFGLFTAYRFVAPDVAGDVAASTWGRLRYCHTQGVFFAWFGNVFLAFLYYVVPRLSARPVKSVRLGWVIFVTWNGLAVIPGWCLVLAGYGQPLEWAEFPLVVDVVAMVGLVLALVQFVPAFLRVRVAQLYVSGWYILGALSFTLFAYPMGNIVPELVPGGMGAAFSGLWTHDAVGLFVTPLALAIAYYVIPATAHRPIYSHFLSLIGFWLLIAIYPLNGMHHYLWSPLPMPEQKGAVLASLYLGGNVCLVVFNLLMSMRGAGRRIVTNLALRFVLTGIVFYLVVSVQGATQAVMPFNRLVHFSDWVVGHAHLAMLGFGTFVGIGGLVHAWEHTPGIRYRAAAVAWSYWLLVGGLLLMVLDLTAAGLVQGNIWKEGLPWSAMLVASRPYWVIRVASGVCLAGGFVMLAVGLVSGNAHVWTRERFERDYVFPIAEPPARGSESVSLRTVHFILVAAGVVSFVLSFVALGLLPARQLRAEMAEGPRTFTGYTPGEARGRIIYGREGCAYCHTQQVRMLDEDRARFGAPTESWETRFDTPHLWGTRRIGPDLAREAGQHTDDWQLTHLYNPRLVFGSSVMPPFPWMFAGDPNHPSQDALDLVAYLQSLGRAKIEQKRADAALVARGSGGPGPLVDATAKPAMAACACMAGDPSGPVFPVSTARADHDRGEQVFEATCSGCHGARGDGRGGAAPSLWPHPADLTAARLSGERISKVLWQGVPGTAMPSFKELSVGQLKTLVAFVASLGPEPRATDVPPAAPRELGGVVYAARCAACHGARGAGDGPGEPLLARLPADFTRKQPTVKRAREVLEQGIPNTAMLPMAQNMSLAEEDAVIAWIRALYRDEDDAKPGLTRDGGTR